MKAIIFLLLLFTCLRSAAQFDSSKTAIRFGLQARDWVFLVPVLDRDVYDLLRDSLNIRFRNNPSLTANATTVVTLDSVDRETILALQRQIRNMPSMYGSFLTRIDAAIEALTDPYIVYHVSLADALVTADITARQVSSLKRLRGQKQ